MKNKHRQDRKKRSRKEDSDSSDDERPKQPPKKQKSNDGPPVNRRMANTKEVIRTRDFKLKLWTGPPGEEVPSEETKQLRKSIGVNVRGECKDAPAPVLSLESEYLPPLFKAYCQQHHILNLTSIQKQSWPSILNGANIIGISPTGSGKTLAFALPAIHHILSAPSSSYQSNKVSPFVLVLAPARELAIQIHSVFKSCRQVKSALLYGGQEKQAQIDSLRSMGKQCKVLVATPGRLLDILHDEDCPLDLNQVSYQVIDEADRMLAMGFLEQLQDVSTYMHPARQILLFSATFPGKLREVCSQWIPQHIMIRVNTIDMNDGNAAKIEADTTAEVKTAAAVAAAASTESSEVAPEKPVAKKTPAVAAVSASAPTPSTNETAEADQASAPAPAPAPAPVKPTSLPASALTVSPTIQQVIHVCAAHKKPRLLIKFIERIRAKEKEEKRRQADPMIVFCNKIKTLGFLNTFLKKQNIPFAMLHGNIPQSQREENLSNFRSGKVNLLVATDVAARGIHIKRLRYVVNYDFPTNLEQYCHRIGRCGRLGTDSGLSAGVVAGAGTMAKAEMTGFAYSLMARNMAPLANDLIALLHSVGQAPEPNLQRLADDFNLGNLFEFGEESETDEKAEEQHENEEEEAHEEE